jgi:hypothetical protein
MKTKCSKCGIEWEITKGNLEKKKTTLCSKCVYDSKILYDTPEKKAISESYRAMMQRCYNPNSPTYKFYGARGVTVCDEWKNDRMKYLKWCLENSYKKGLHLDKDILSKKLGISPPIYSPDTCMYITAKENSVCKVNSRHVVYKGRRQTVSQWAEELGVKTKTLAYRLKLGWSDEETINTPIGAIRPSARAVCQYDTNNVLVAEYSSTREADKRTGISYKSISNTLRGKSKSAGGFKWKFKI